VTGLQHPAGASRANVRIHGRRVLLRPLFPADFAQYAEVRGRNHEWLLMWEPSRIVGAADPASDQHAFAGRCVMRDKERQMGAAYGLGLFVGDAFIGEINLNSIQRGALQSATVGYWVDQTQAGHAYVAEGVVALSRFAFEELNLHRLEICIIPRNHRSRRVMEKLAIRDEGIAERYLEINGAWEDHVRYAMTAEEWSARRAELNEAWLSS